ncbi:MAG: hypothetical protein FWD56_04370 [Bacteroidales bacterium]|nr:hypothetical protein [Bacteroidales bacterium]
MEMYSKFKSGAHSKSETSQKRLANMGSVALLCLILLCGKYAYSQTTASIENIWQTHNVVNNDEQGMNIHVKFSFTGMLNKTGWCAAYFYNETGGVLIDKNQSYGTADGQVSTGSQFTPNIADGIYSDFVLFIPYSELHLPDGQHNIRFFVTIFDNTMSIANSDFHEFQINWTQPTNTLFSQNSSQQTLYNRTQQNSGVFFESRQQAGYNAKHESEKHTSINVGVLMGGGSLIGADLEFLVMKRLGLQLGAGITSMGLGINYHFEPYINSQFVSVQYWHQGFGNNHYASYLGPVYTYRAQKIFQISLGFGTVLSRGPLWNMDKDTPVALLYSIGLFFPL